jgi:hypothetical protein
MILPTAKHAFAIKRRFAMIKSAILIGVTIAAPMLAAGPTTPKAQATYSSQDTSAVCPVTGRQIEPGQGVKVTIKGHDYLVFDQASADMLKSDPDKYLDPDGTPKNAKK